MVLRTPDDRFENLPGYDFAPNYIEINGLRMHYVDEGAGSETILCLHGEPTWSYLYRKVITPLSEHYRVVAPDLIGFGRSDKLPEMDDYSFTLHFDSLIGFIQALDLKQITLICQDWGGVLGLPAATRLSERFARLVILNTFLPVGDRPAGEAFMQWRAFVKKVGKAIRVGDLIARTITYYDLSPEIIAAYDAPFPDDRYKAGAAVFPLLVPIKPDDPGVPEITLAREILSQWQKPALVMFSDSDPILGGAVNFFRRLIPTAKEQPEITIQQAGHFLQEEKGEEIAQHVHEFIQRTSSV